MSGEDQPVLYEIGLDSFQGLPVVRLIGEFDLRAAPDLREALVGVLDRGVGKDTAPSGAAGAGTGGSGGSAEAGGSGGSGGTVLVDMEGLRFLDSTIISVLLSAEQLAQENGRRVRLAAVPAHVLRIFGVTGIEGVLKSYPSLEDAASATD